MAWMYGKLQLKGVYTSSPFWIDFSTFYEIETRFCDPWKQLLNRIRRSDLSQPVGVGQRQVRESTLPLDEVPRCPDVVVPRDDPLHRVANHVEVDGLGDVEPVESQISFSRWGWGLRFHRLVFRGQNLIFWAKVVLSKFAQELMSSAISCCLYAKY